MVYFPFQNTICVQLGYNLRMFTEKESYKIFHDKEAETVPSILATSGTEEHLNMKT